MKTLAAISLTLFTIALGAAAYQLCFTATTFGGILPWAAITAGPALGFAIGRTI